MLSRTRHPGRNTEAVLLALVITVLALGLALTSVGLQLRQDLHPLAGLPGLVPPVALVAALLAGAHFLLRLRRRTMEQILLPIVSLLFALGLIAIYRVRGAEGVWQQLLRGFVPGMGILMLFIWRPQVVETMRRWTLPLSLIGLALPIATAFFGVVDETGARLSLRLGPLPPIQTSDIIKIALIFFLAWYIEREGREATGRARIVLGGLRLPAVRHLLPGGMFVVLGTLALVQMRDYGAVLILTILFAGMLYAGFETRVFATVGLLGLGLALLAGAVLSVTWEVPIVIRYRFIAFVDPWSDAPLLLDGEPTGITVAEGPGYQIQQSIYATIAGGLTGTGLGLGTPSYVPLAHSDFIFAVVLEEMGAVVGLPALFLFAVVMLRLLRLAAVLPRVQEFERLVLVGIGIHLFVQVFVMVGGTLNLLPLTGVTIPFMSLGGAALIVNLAEIGIALGLAARLEEARR
ncbi:MAG TPA: FtsW/RodA/SpoVE family cell cycle protein [Anaerolineales bacterium]|nr:FtsW/RodA/SpoVE family cell cycle protein [Anaerolineales bacterium]